MQAVSFLIADDIESARLSLRRLLAFCPEWQVMAEVGDGLEAVQWAAENRPNVALLDVMMPGLDGIHAAERIKTVSPETRVIVYSTYHDEAFRRHALMAGADIFFRREDLDGPIIEVLLANWFPDMKWICT